MTPPTNNPGKGNPAAERLRDLIVNRANGAVYRRSMLADLDAALLHERRATVERDVERLAKVLRGLAESFDPEYGSPLNGLAYDDLASRHAARLIIERLDATASEEEARPTIAPFDQCASCDGEGELSDGMTCPRCNGRGIVTASEEEARHG